MRFPWKYLRTDISIFLFFSLIAFAFTYPIFNDFENLGIQDWDFFFFHQAVSRSTILDYHQIPLWNPYYCGGAVLLADPQSRFLSPFFILTLFFGVVEGIKLEIWLHLAFGMLGTYKLSRYYKLDRFVSLLPPLIFFLNSMYALSLAVGMAWFLSVAYLPWVFLYYLKSFYDTKYAILSSVFLVLMYYEGGAYPLLITFLFIALYSILSVKKEGLLKSVRLLSLTLILVFCLGAIKFSPSIELFMQYPRKMNEYSGFSLNSLRGSLLDRNQSLDAIEKYADKKGFITGISYYMDANAMYVGFLPLLLFLVGIKLHYKHKWRLTWCFLIFLWLAFGDRAPISLWKILHSFPPFSSMRVAQHFRQVFMLCFALFSGFGFQSVKNTLLKKINNFLFARVISAAILLAILIDLMFVNSQVLESAFIIPPLDTARSPTFYHTRAFPYPGMKSATNYSDIMHIPWSSMYPAFLGNIGTINCYESIKSRPKSAIPRDSDYYKGEVFLQGTDGFAKIINWSPNKLVINFNASGKGYLIINQNYNNGWGVKGGSRKVESMNGLLAVEVFPHETELEVSYHPKSFIAGSIVTSTTLLLLMLYFLKERELYKLFTSMRNSSSNQK